MSEPVLDRVRATRARNGTLVAFAVNGLAFASWMSRVPDVRDQLHLLKQSAFGAPGTDNLSSLAGRSAA